MSASETSGPAGTGHRRDNAEAAAGPDRPGRMRYLLALLPLILFAGLAAIFYDQLISGHDASEVPSALIGKQAPPLDLPPVEGLARADGTPTPGLTTATIKGKLTLVNVFASWCVPCRQEHPLLSGIAKDTRIQLVGLNYKDKPENARAFLGELGNPYAAVGADRTGRTGIDWGVYGVPETYLVAPDGTILYKRIGPFTEEAIETELKPAIDKATAAR